MQILTLSFNAPVNASLQVGDTVYYHPANTLGLSGAFSTASYNKVIAFGTVSGIVEPLSASPHVIVYYDDSTGISPPTTNDYIMFGKDKTVNSSGLIGNYALVKFINNSRQEAELFSIGSEVSESSK